MPISALAKPAARETPVATAVPTTLPPKLQLAKDEILKFKDRGVVEVTADPQGRLIVTLQRDDPALRAEISAAVFKVAQDVPLKWKIGGGTTGSTKDEAKKAAEAIAGVQAAEWDDDTGKLVVYLSLDTEEVRQQVMDSVWKVDANIRISWRSAINIDPDPKKQLAKAAGAAKGVVGVMATATYPDEKPPRLKVYLKEDDDDVKADIMARIRRVAIVGEKGIAVDFEVLDPGDPTVEIKKAQKEILALRGVVNCRIVDGKLIVTLKDIDDIPTKIKCLDIAKKHGSPEVQFVPDGSPPLSDIQKAQRAVEALPGVLYTWLEGRPPNELLFIKISKSDPTATRELVFATIRSEVPGFDTSRLRFDVEGLVGSQPPPPPTGSELNQALRGITGVINASPVRNGEVSVYLRTDSPEARDAVKAAVLKYAPPGTKVKFEVLG